MQVLCIILENLEIYAYQTGTTFSLTIIEKLREDCVNQMELTFAKMGKNKQ